MFDILSQFFRDNQSFLSMNRLLAFISIIGSLIITVYAIQVGAIKDSEITVIVCTYIAVAFGSKVVQKNIELNSKEDKVE